MQMRRRLLFAANKLVHPPDSSVTAMGSAPILNPDRAFQGHLRAVAIFGPTNSLKTGAARVYVVSHIGGYWNLWRCRLSGKPTH
jgi:hypothetical protein